MKKILVIRFSSIGDIILTTPVLRCLKQQYPEAEIHFLTKAKFSELLAHNPYITRIHAISESVREVADALRSESYDYVVDLHRNLRSSQTKRLLRKPSGTIRKLNFRKWLLASFHVNFMPDIHIVDRYFDAVRSLGVNNDNAGLDFLAGQDSTPEWEEKVPDAFRHDVIALVIGGTYFTKKIPEKLVLEIASLLKKRVVILGGPGEKDEGERIVSQLGNKAFNACGLLSIGASAEALRASTAVITGDTGLMHIASALKKPIVSVWGNTVPAFGMYPYLPGNEHLSFISEVDGLKCRPCSKLGFEKCPKKHFRCMTEQNVTAIAKFLATSGK
ncbi:MAG: glycosyltransferase family 9 protein [Bacteroidetes bacterium]|nr:glycosyltransferase family 9 protein [Bacteroidota bacterium]MBU1719968.1 glycosyltransferase family 9 protein [Bacteroidota bacterium]